MPIHCILASEYAQIKTQCPPKLGSQGEPVAELAKVGWTILPPGKESDVTGMMLIQTMPHGYARLCLLDVLGFGEEEKTDQSDMCTTP